MPGTYSLFPLSQEEIVTRDFICFGNPDAVIVVCDSTCIEKKFKFIISSYGTYGQGHFVLKFVR